MMVTGTPNNQEKVESEGCKIAFKASSWFRAGFPEDPGWVGVGEESLRVNVGQAFSTPATGLRLGSSLLCGVGVGGLCCTV